MEQIENKMAVLIDAENISYKDISLIFNELKQRGTLVIKRVFGNIESINKNWKESCNENGITINTQFNYTTGKNVSDISLTIEAMDILYTKQINTFVIISSDSDYTGLASRLREENKYVIGIGEQKTPPSLRRACDDFIIIDNLKDDSKIHQENMTSLEDITRDIKNIISETENNTIQLSRLHEILKNQYPDFDCRTYGFNKFNKFIESIPEIHIETLRDKTTMIAHLTSEKLAVILHTIRELLNTSASYNIGELKKQLVEKHPNFSEKNYGANCFSKFLSTNLKDEISISKNIVKLKKQ